MALGFGDDHYRYHDHDKLAHYANAATDIEFLMPFGFKEVEGIHSRTNFDLSQHEKFSGKNIKYFDPETNESYTPYVIETSIGVDRMFLSIMSASYCEEQLENGETRVVLKLPAALAPVKLAVMPLVKKDGLPEKAREIIDNLKFHFHCQYDEKDSRRKSTVSREKLRRCSRSMRMQSQRLNRMQQSMLRKTRKLRIWHHQRKQSDCRLKEIHTKPCMNSYSID